MIEDYFVVDPGKWYIKCGIVGTKTEPQVTILDRKEEREDAVCKALQQHNPQHLPLVLLARPSYNLVLLSCSPFHHSTTLLTYCLLQSKIEQIYFEKYEVEKLSVLSTPVMASWFYGERDSCVVDAGYSVSIHSRTLCVCVD